MTGAAPGARVPQPGDRIEINADDYEIVACPDCGRPAFVEWRTHIESTNGAVEHLKILCLDRHWFFLPVSSVVRPEAHPAADSSQPPTRTTARRVVMFNIDAWMAASGRMLARLSGRSGRGFGSNQAVRGAGCPAKTTRSEVSG